MAWGTDLLAGLGGAMQGGLAMHQQQKAEEYRRQRDEQIDDLKKQLAEMKGTQQLEQIEKRNVGKQAIQQLVNVGKLDLERLNQEGDKYLEELHQQGRISLEEKMQIGRMSLAERNNAASQKRVETQGDFAQKRVETQGQTQRDVANTQVGGDITTTGMRTKSAEQINAENEAGRNNRFFKATFPIARGNMEANQARAKNAGNPYGMRPASETPVFTPWDQLGTDLQNTPPPVTAPPPPARLGPQTTAPAPRPAAPAPGLPAGAPQAAPAPRPSLFGPGSVLGPGVTSPAPGGPAAAPPAAVPAPGRPAAAPSLAAPPAASYPAQPGPGLAGSAKAALTQKIAAVTARMNASTGPQREHAKAELAALVAQVRAASGR